MSDQDSTNEICRDYMRKACTRGSSCKFRHPGGGTEKTYEFCRDYQNSFCHRSNCKFIHCSAEAEDYYNDTGNLPRSYERESSPEGQRMPPQSSRDIPLCKDFLSGQCKRGMKCKYRHRSIGDIEYEDRHRTANPPSQDPARIKSRDSPRETSPPPFDEYSHDLARRRAAPDLLYCSRQSRLDDYTNANGAYYDSQRARSMRDFEEENLRLHRRIEDLRKQVDDLTATNEVLLEQNARLRAIKNNVSAVLLAESHLVRSTSAITPAAQVHLTAATAGVVPYPARVAAAAPTAAQVASANATAQVITAELQGLPVSIASAAGIPTASLPSVVMAPQVPAHSSVQPSVCVTSSLMTYPLPSLCNVATVTVPNVVNVANVPTPNRLGP